MTLTGGQFTLNWHPVTTATNGQLIAIDHYVVYRYDAIGSTPTVTVPLVTNSYTDTVGGLTFYYRVVAVSAGCRCPPPRQRGSLRSARYSALTDPYSSGPSASWLPGFGKMSSAYFIGASLGESSLDIETNRRHHRGQRPSKFFQMSTGP